MVLLACGGGPGGSFRARSASSHYAQTATFALELGPDDVAAVSKAGGMRIGQYVGDVDNAYAYDIAQYGGTHFIVRAAHAEETGGAYVPGGWRKTYRRTLLADVYRVPVSGWSQLPNGLVPEKN